MPLRFWLDDVVPETKESHLSNGVRRCQSRGGSDDNGGDYQCGLPDGHDGPHSATFVPGAPWDRRRSPRPERVSH